MRHTIRHDGTGRAILAYLATHGRAWTKTARITAYMALMHGASEWSVRTMLRRFVRRGLLYQARRGWYAIRWEIVQ